MRTHHPGKTSDTDQRRRTADRIATPAPRLHASVYRDAINNVVHSPGQPLAAPMKQEMEARLGADFSRVRVHTDSAARDSATEVGARAYTFGPHVVIGPGASDKHTLAHELTHVIQQHNGLVTGTDNGSGLRISDPGDHLEHQAETSARHALSSPFPQHSAHSLPSSLPPPAAAIGTRAALQRMPKQNPPRKVKQTDTSAPYSPRLRAKAKVAGPAGPWGNAAPPPGAGWQEPPLGSGPQKFWNETRESIPFDDATQDHVYDNASPETDSQGRTTYKCANSNCPERVPRLRDAAAGENSAEIDHKEGILSHVHRNVDTNKYRVELGADGNGTQRYRDAEGILLSEAKAAANNVSNLQVLCKKCNLKRAPGSKSRYLDKTGPQWAGEPY